MRLAAMRYKNYVWPHNPRTYTVDYERKMAVQKVPFGSYLLEDLGLTRRVMRGEGEFVGPDAYEEFKKLATVFYLPGAGPLVHPVWQSAEVYFVDLRLRQEPRADYVSYSFTFWEKQSETSSQPRLTLTKREGSGGQAETGENRWHTVQAGETLWEIARRYGVGLTELIGRNSWIKNPNFIVPGEKVLVG